jgi:hypothetical protein
MQPLSEIERIRKETVDGVLGRNRAPAPAVEGPPSLDVPQQPTGRALRWSRDQVAALALPTPTDIERARARLQQTRDERLILLLLAVVSADEAERFAVLIPYLLRGFVFSPALMRYFYFDRERRTVTSVSAEYVTSAVDDFIERARLIPLTLMADLLKGDLPIGLWQSLMRDEVMAMHLVAAAATAGGFERALSRAETLRPMLGFHLERLDRFARQLESGGLDLNGDLFARSELYANAARMTRFNLDVEMREEVGVQQARRVRTILESCPGCVRLAGGLDVGGSVETVNRGFIPIGELVPLGGEECLMNCLCYVQYLEAGAGGVGRSAILEEAGRIREALGFQ